MPAALSSRIILSTIYNSIEPTIWNLILDFQVQVHQRDVKIQCATNCSAQEIIFQSTPLPPSLLPFWLGHFIFSLFIGGWLGGAI